MGFVEGGDGRATSWVFAGPDVDLDAEDVWTAIETRLRSAPEAPCVGCDGLTLSRGDLLDAVRDFELAPHHRLVGLMTARSIASIVATLAVWRNGGVYVPLAEECGSERLRAQVEACALDVVISDRPLDLPGYGPAEARDGVDARLFLHRREGQRTRNPALTDPALCQIAHTSGTTGAPKAVLISHQGLLNRLSAMQRFLDVTPEDRFVYKTPVVFDVHLWEFTLPLISGAFLVIYRPKARFELREVAELMVEAGVTVVGFAPALLRLLLRISAFVSGNTLRAVLCGGEAWSPQLAREVRAKLPGRALYNAYGPTETTMVATNWRVPEDPGLDEIALGEPHQNTTLLVEERQRIATREGEQIVGPLLIGGVQVALGYLGPCGGDRFETRRVGGRPVRFFRTGDLVRLDPARGRIVFHGREDNLVKIGGIRVELDEVEAVISDIRGVRASLAFVASLWDRNQLWALVEPDEAGGLDMATVTAACRARLAGAAMPAVLRQVTRLPLRPSGKHDRALVLRRLSGCCTERDLSAAITYAFGSPPAADGRRSAEAVALRRFASDERADADAPG